MDTVKLAEWMAKNNFQAIADTLGDLDGQALWKLSRNDLRAVSADGDALYNMLHLLKDGLDGLLGVNSGQWWVAKEKLCGGWPMWP